MRLETIADKVVETDVLVIGGGMAGCFAAIKAKEQGIEVILVDKGYVGKSGQTPFATLPAVFNPDWGHNLDDLMDFISKTGDYVNNREWTKIVFEECYARTQDLISWGVKFSETEDGELRRIGTSDETGLEGSYEMFHTLDFALPLRKQAVKSGVRVMDRIMVTDLLKQDGRVIGGVGITMDSNDFYIFKAKATIISSGGGGFKPAQWPNSELTGDGQAMAYRAGAEITGEEFPDTHFVPLENPAQVHEELLTPIPKDVPKDFKQPIPKYFNANGDQVFSSAPFAMHLQLEFEVHAGRGPVYADIGYKLADVSEKCPIVGGTAGMSVYKAAGIWPTNTYCASNLPGLYAAGDSCGTMQLGAVYSALGLASMGSAVTGARAGVGASEYALQAEKPILDKKELTTLKKAVYAPLERKGGFSPTWVTRVLQNTMIPYFILRVKHGDRLQAALTIIEFLRNHLAPKLTAKDAHELRLAHETKSMIVNAEMKLRASLFRTESRGVHYREDYPRRDDPNWLAWVKVKEEQGEMKLKKVPIPKEWWPDLSTPYEERYPFRYPGE